MGIGPTLQPWEGRALPLCNARKLRIKTIINYNMSIVKSQNKASLLILFLGAFLLLPLISKADTTSSSAAIMTDNLMATSTDIISTTTSIITVTTTSDLIATSTANITTNTTATVVAPKMSIGAASWYAGMEEGMFTASPDYPRGTKLQVTNLDNKKTVIVEVNDYGPDRKIFPNRVVDLNRDAFAAIASLGAGVVQVSVTTTTDPLAPLAPDTIASKGQPQLNAKSAIIINATTGKVLFAKNADKVLPLASLTKIIAAKVFLDTKPDLNKKITYKKQDTDLNMQYVNYAWEAASLKVKDGETMTLDNTLAAALIGSANNAVNTLVRNSGLSREQFIAKMNKYVKKIGARNTKFVEPTGLSPENVSTANDYALISKEVLKNATVKKLTSLAKYTFTTINTKKKHTFKNTNKIIAEDKFAITGSKTGYLEEAGHCLMTRTVVGNNKQIVAVVMGSPSSASVFSDMKKLLSYGQEKLKIKN